MRLQPSGRTFALLPVFCVGWWAADGSVQAQEGLRGTGTIRGEVYDSATQSALPDAAVFLWSTTHRAVTDSAGRFVLEGVPAGSHPVTVESQPLPERSMGGLTIARVDIDRIRGRVRDAADILRAQNIPGLIVRRRNDGTLCVGIMPGQVRMMFRSGCVPMVVFVNNVRTTSVDMALQLPPDAIDRMVIYRPVEAGNLFGLGSGNGVLTIFTRQR